MLLSIDTNAKTVKGQRYGYLTGVLYLAPETLSGRNVCPMAGIAGCAQACLNTAGRGAFTSVQSARINKTRKFFADPQAFLAQLKKDILALERKAKRGGFIPLVRLNGTSDIRWENVRDADGKNLMECFPHIQFYDYTKIANRRNIPANYDLTFSYSGIDAYQPYVEKARAQGMRLAVVFDRRENIPTEYLGMQVVDGDDSDIRHVDPQGVVVALYAKGRARRDTSGFVIRIKAI